MLHRYFEEALACNRIYRLRHDHGKFSLLVPSKKLHNFPEVSTEEHLIGLCINLVISGLVDWTIRQFEFSLIEESEYFSCCVSAFFVNGDYLFQAQILILIAF